MQLTTIAYKRRGMKRYGPTPKDRWHGSGFLAKIRILKNQEFQQTRENSRETLGYSPEEKYV